jgi:acetyl esterase
MLSAKLDSNVRRLLEALRAEGGPPLETLPVETGRRAAAEILKRYAGEPEPVESVTGLRIPGPAGEIPIRVYRPEASEPAPGMLYFHGGGWVVCGIETHDSTSRALARRAGAVIISVEYPLSPEHKFPAALEASYAATCWAAENAGRLGIDPKRLAVGGDSAGGNLSAVICLKARDENGPALSLQVLIYPVTDLSSFDTPSYREFSDEHWLTRSEMEWFRDQYLARPEDAREPYASPLLAPDLRGLPRALVITAQCDPLRDEGAAYAGRLASAGVPVSYCCYPGMIHPFFSLGGAIPQAFDAIDRIAAALKE